MTTTVSENSPGSPCSALRQSEPALSIIIPTVNEAELLGATLAQLAKLMPAAHEIIVVDAGSVDATIRIAKSYSATIIESEIRRRSYQMDAGARAATGDILAFVHADTLVPTDSLKHMRQALANPNVTLAGFTSIMRGQRIQRFTTFHNRIKTYYAPFLYRPFAVLFKGLRLLFGDQVMFCRRSDYLRVGGFDPTMEILEEADLCLKMNSIGAVRQLRSPVFTSDRRVARVGVVRANLMFIWITFGWGYGASKSSLRRLFDRV
ncbi:MAG: TIGR04283 family arsenosugar biosynthesis glycosyltransferase [Pseudomonadota bacterium]